MTRRSSPTSYFMVILPGMCYPRIPRYARVSRFRKGQSPMFPCLRQRATAILCLSLKEARLAGRARVEPQWLPEHGGGMKICRVVLCMTLSTSTGAVLGAQTLPDKPILVASETMPDGGLFLPELLQSMPVTPAIGQATLAKPATGPAPRLTGRDRLTLFLNDTYASPGAYAGLSAGALVDQMMHTPAKWDQDGSGYTRRFASEYGQLATRNVIHDGLAGVTGLDPRYMPCKCDGTLRRTGHALKMSFTTYRQDGRLTLDVPQFAGAYGSGMISTYWYPHNLYNPLVQGVQFGHEQMGEIVLSNLVKEFSPDLQRALHWHAITARSPNRPADDD